MKYYLFDTRILSIDPIEKFYFDQIIQSMLDDIVQDENVLVFQYDPFTQRIYEAYRGELEGYWFHVFADELHEDVNIDIKTASRYLKYFQRVRPEECLNYLFSINSTGTKLNLLSGNIDEPRNSLPS